MNRSVRRARSASRVLLGAAFVCLLVSVSVIALAAQIRLPRLPRGVPREIARLDRLPSLDDLLGRQPLTSSLDDAITEVPFLDRFDPKQAAPLGDEDLNRIRAARARVSPRDALRQAAEAMRELGDHFASLPAVGAPW
jgi:hypothetical protein